MRRSVRFAVVLGLVVPGLAIAHPHSHSGRTHSDDKLGWAVVHDGDKHSSTVDDVDDVHALVERYGDDFLYIRDDGERFVIRDPKMIERAEEAAHAIGGPVREITTVAKAQAKLAVSQVAGARVQAKLARLEAKLERKIESAERDRDDEKEKVLRRELEDVRDELQDLEAHPEETHLSKEEERDLERRRDQAQDRLQEAIDDMRAEIRQILREAKDKGLAERVR